VGSTATSQTANAKPTTPRYVDEENPQPAQPVHQRAHCPNGSRCWFSTSSASLTARASLTPRNPDQRAPPEPCSEQSPTRGRSLLDIDAIQGTERPRGARSRYRRELRRALELCSPRSAALPVPGCERSRALP
jgi:hypothetical protein